MNRPKHTRETITIKPLGEVPKRNGPNRHARNSQPEGYYSQTKLTKFLKRNQRQEATVES